MISVTKFSFYYSEYFNFLRANLRTVTKKVNGISHALYSNLHPTYICNKFVPTHSKSG